MSNRVELLEEAQSLLAEMGVEIRQQWSNAVAGGLCRIDSQWILFSDPRLAHDEQMSELISAILTVSESEQFAARHIPISRSLRECIVAAVDGAAVEDS